MPQPHRRLTQELRDEAVRLGETSGRTRREAAEDLWVGLSTMRHWLDRRRERQINDPPKEWQEDGAAELKRLRRENEFLRQERDILKWPPLMAWTVRVPRGSMGGWDCPVPEEHSF
jgi:transposase